MVEAISGEKPAHQAVLGDASSRNEKSGILASCLLVEWVLFRPLAIRYDVFPGHMGCDTPGSQKAPSAKRCIKTVCLLGLEEHDIGVRKHRAPKGALRRAHPAVVMVSHRSESTERQKVH